MSDEMREIKEDVKEIKADVKSISATVVRNTASLEAHMLRTSLNEVRINKMEVWTLGLLTSIVLSLVALLVKALS